MATKKAAAKAEENLPVSQEDPTAGVPATFDFAEDAGLGYENQTNADIAIPFLNVLQKGSPQIDAEDSPYKPGMLFNTVTEEAYKGSEGLTIVPVTTEHVFVEWIPRDNGGGFVGVHKPDSPVVMKAKAESKKYGKYKTPAGNDLVDTFQLYAIKADDPEDFFIIPLTSTKIKPYKTWNTKVKKFNPRPFGIDCKLPMFCHRVKLTTVKEVRGEYTSYTLEFNPLNAATETHPAIWNSMIGTKHPAYVAAKEFLAAIQSGIAKAAYETNSQDVAESGSGATIEDEAAPF